MVPMHVVHTIIAGRSFAGLSYPLVLVLGFPQSCLKLAKKQGFVSGRLIVAVCAFHDKLHASDQKVHSLFAGGQRQICARYVLAPKAAVSVMPVLTCSSRLRPAMQS